MTAYSAVRALILVPLAWISVAAGADGEVLFIETRNPTDEIQKVLPEARVPEEAVAGEVAPPRERDRIFGRAGVLDEISEMDHLDRDLLFYRARKLPLDALARKYPKLKRESLGLLREQVSRYKSDARPGSGGSAGKAGE